MEPYGIAGPFLIIKITGGIGVKIHIRNIGNETAYEINWSVAITGGILGFVDMRVDGTFAELLPGNEIYESNLFLGFGKLEIAAASSSLNAEGVSKIKNGFLLLFFVLILG